MSNLLRLAIGLCCAMALTVSAAEGKKKGTPPTEEQKAIRKEMTEKYDANKDKKLDKEEMAKMSAEDKAKWSKAFPAKKKEK